MARLGSYELAERIGQGGMAEVFLAKRAVEGVERRMVIKRILPAFCEMPEFVQMFVNEAKVASQLEHPNITQLLDFGQEDGAYFLAIEYVQGTNLDALIRTARKQGELLPVDVVLKIVALACEALDYAHALTDEEGEPLGFIHRDISPDNILVGYNGAVKVTDFGIARTRTLPKLTQTGRIKGKPNYAAPEYLRGKGIDQRADLFGLGVVLYEGLAGTRPFDGPDLAQAIRAVVKDPTPDVRQVRGDVPDAVQAVIERALQKDPVARYQTAKEFLTDLEAVMVEQRRTVSGRAIADLAMQYFPPARRASVSTASQVALEPTFTSQKAMPDSGPDDGTSDTFVRKLGDPLPSAPSVSTAVQRRVKPAVTEPMGMKSQPQRTQAASRPNSGASSAWSSSGGKAEIGEDGPEEDSAVMRAHRAALELADKKFDANDEPAQYGNEKGGPKRKIPATVAIPAVLLIGATLIFASRFIGENMGPREQTAQVEKTPNKLIEITTNVPADVFINDVSVGRTPFSVENNYPFGQKVAVSIRAVGYLTVDGEILGGIGQRVTVQFVKAPAEEE